jgi:uncharacterized membrane protein
LPRLKDSDMKLLFSRILDMLKDKNAGFIGGAVAFILALLLVLFGIPKTIFIIIFTLIGYLVGVRLFSDKDKLKDFLDKLIPPGRFR